MVEIIIVQDYTQKINVNENTHIHTVLKLRDKHLRLHLGQRFNDNRKRQKPKENQQGMLKIYAFCWKIQQRTSGQGESAAWVRYLYMRIHPKSCHIFPLKVAATLLSVQRKAQLEHSSHLVKVCVEARC